MTLLSKEAFDNMPVTHELTQNYVCQTNLVVTETRSQGMLDIYVNLTLTFFCT